MKLAIANGAASSALLASYADTVSMTGPEADETAQAVTMVLAMLAPPDPSKVVYLDLVAPVTGDATLDLLDAWHGA